MDTRAGWGLSLVVVWLVAGCGADGASSGPPDAGEDNETEVSGSAVLTDRAVVVDEAALAALEGAEESDAQVALTFGSGDVLDEIEGGDVLIFGSSELLPKGALLEVTDVEREDARLVLITQRAALGAAFEELSIDLEATLARPSETRGTVASLLTQDVAVSRQALGLAFPFSFTGQGDNQSELSGSVALDSSFALGFAFDFEDGLTDLSMRLDASETFDAQLIAAGESTFEEESELGFIGFPPITFLIPVVNVPVVLTPQIVLAAGVSGELRGEAQASVLQGATFYAGLGYQNGEFGGFSDSDSTFTFDPPIYEAGASLRAWAGPRVEVLVYGAVGPFISASAYVELAAQIDGPPLCTTGVLNAGVMAEAGVQVIADYETPLFDESEALAQYDSCNPDDPEAPRPATTWSRTYGRADSPGETARAVIQLADGSFVVAGQSDLFDDVAGFAASAWVMRLNPLGQVIWQRAFRRESLGLVRGLVAVPGGVLVAGDAGIMKLDGGGTPTWAKSYAGDELIQIASLAAQEDGSFVVVGIAGTIARAWAMGADAQGEVQWSRSFAGDDFSRVRATTDGGYVVVGKVVEAFDISVVKLDGIGEVQWARTVDNLFDPNPEEGDVIATSDDRAYDIAEKPDGGYVVIGEAYGNFPLPEPTPVGFYGTWVVELDADGELGDAGSVTHRAPLEGLYGGAYAVAVRPDGTSVIIGRRADEARDLLVNEDILVIQGLTYSVLGGAGNDSVDSGTLTGVGRGMPLALTADGGAIVAATSTSFGGRDEVWLIKLNRTASINLPERSSIRGSSFVNGAAQSVALDTNPADVAVTATDFTSEIDWETTEVSTEQQAP